MSARPVSIRVGKRLRRFATIKDAAAAFNLKPVVVLKRLNRGWTPEQAVDLSPPPPKPTHVLAKALVVRDGGRVRRFLSMNAAAEEYGIAPAKVSTRIGRLHWTAEQALELQPPPAKKLPPNSKPITVLHNGQRRRFSSLSAAAKAFRLRPALVHKRWMRFGWTLEQALGISPRPPRRGVRSKPTTFTHQGKRFRYASILEAAQAHGLNHGTVLSRLQRLKWNIRQALGLAAPPAHSKDHYGFIYVVRHRASGRQYVGQTLLPIKSRWEEHVRTAETADPNGPHLRCAIRKHGRRAFSIREIDHTESFHDANSKERKWIRHLRTLHPHGFNMNSGGGGINLGRPLIVRGTRYPSIAEAARAHGLAPLKVASRLRDHEWTIEQALGLQKPPERTSAPIEVTLTVGGRKQTFSSIKAAAAALRKDYSVVRQRMHGCGWTVAQAFDVEPPPDRKPSRARPITFTHAGRTYRYESLTEAAMAHSVDDGVAGMRINRLGWSFAQAFGIAPAPQTQAHASKQICFRHGKKWYRYKSIQDAAKTYRLKAPTVAARIRSGWTYAQALGISSPPKSLKRPDCAVVFTHNGVRYTYDSVSDAAKARRLKPGTVNARIRSGYSIQQALGFSPPPLRGRWLNK